METKSSSCLCKLRDYGQDMDDACATLFSLRRQLMTKAIGWDLYKNGPSAVSNVDISIVFV